MSIDVQVHALIPRSAAEVFAFVTDVSKDVLWTSGLLDARLVTDGPYATGARVARTSKFLGRRMVYTLEITEVVPDARVEMITTAGPFPMQISYRLEPEGGGTRLFIRAAGDPGGFYALAGPLLASAVRRQIQLDLDTLADLLAAPAN